MENIGKRLRLAREAAGYATCCAAAHFLQMGTSTLNDYEAERRFPGAENLRWICEGYGVSADWLLGIDTTAG